MVAPILLVDRKLCNWGTMTRTFATISLAIFAASSLAAQDMGKYKKAMRDVASAETSIDACSIRGYTVDADGVSLWRSVVRGDAIAAGMAPDEADAYQSDEIESENERLRARHRRASVFGKQSDLGWRFEQFWSKRCKKLSKDEQTRDFFWKSDEG